MGSEICDTEKDEYCTFLYVDLKKKSQTHKQIVDSGFWGQKGKESWEVLIKVGRCCSSYEMSTFWSCNIQHGHYS